VITEVRESGEHIISDETESKAINLKEDKVQKQERAVSSYYKPPAMKIDVKQQDYAFNNVANTQSTGMFLHA